jgi:hypothetical protein
MEHRARSPEQGAEVSGVPPRLSKGGVLFLCAALVTACPVTQPVREICGNGFDDDGNGLADCADPDCSGQQSCPVTDGGTFGSCARCGDSCTKQENCLEYAFNSDRPLPDCAAGRCQSFNQALQVAVRVDVGSGGWSFVNPVPQTMQMRFIRKTALDGTAVTCAVVQAVATSNAAADADQVERSGKFNLVGYDVTPLSGSLGGFITQPFVNVGTSQDFLIWVEIWSGVREATTKLPTGIRRGWGCFESGAAVAALVLEDHCPASPTSPTCRTIQVEMPAPL